MTPDLSWLHRGTEEIFPNRPDSDDDRENLEVLLARCDRPLRVKLGIDPTGSDLHLGIVSLSGKCGRFRMLAIRRC